MRINCYEEELTDEVALVESAPRRQPDGSMVVFYGARLILDSSPKLHHDEHDDDRSVVTFWFSDKRRAEILRDHLRRDLATTVIGRHPK